MKQFELGIFMPVGNNGWIMSKNSPQYKPTFELNKNVALLAEKYGFDYIFAMAKWKGFGGEVDFWKYSVESTALIAALGAVTKRLRLVTSVAPALIHPAVYAKMVATADDVCSGRIAINVVTAGNKDEYVQMGMYPKDFESFRHEYFVEWLEVVKRLWTEEKVTHDGKYFSLTGCESFPKPVHQPSIVYATTSDWGFNFAGKSCDEVFTGGNSIEKKNATSLRIKEIAKQYQRPVKSHTMILLIIGDTQEEADQLLSHYWEGADHEAIGNVHKLRFRDNLAEQNRQHNERFAGSSMLSMFYGGSPIVGTPEKIAGVITQLVEEGDFDGIMLTFPDFEQGVIDFGEKVMPLLRETKVLDAIKVV